jgi:RNA polymerase sigma-70 factor (ECF subfamily)
MTGMQAVPKAMEPRPMEPEPMEPGSMETDLPAGGEWTEGWPRTPEGFGRLVEAFQDPLVRYAFRRLRDRHEAEDAVQDVFLRAYRSRESMGSVRNVRAYLYCMTGNACTDRLRRRKRQRALFVPASDCRIESIADDRTGADDDIAAAEALDRVDRLLAVLPRRQAEVIRLRVLDELSLPDIATALHCRLATVKSRLRYGLQKLRRAARRERSR